jgi:D-alanine-D-alanine ligase-like ATP-grasp enzyme/acylphosphatase
MFTIEIPIDIFCDSYYISTCGHKQQAKYMEVMSLKLNHSISLPHLTSEVVKGARKTKLCAYSVALEGWRRGLTLKWYTADSDKFNDMVTFGVNPPGRLFSLSSKERTHYFFRTRGDKVSSEAVEVGSDKDDTKVILSKAGVPTPAGKKFLGDDTDEEIINYSSTIEFPLVLKPTNGSLGNGVITNIKNQAELRKALVYVRQELDYPEVILERFCPGEEYRVYVIEDKVIAAYNRLPASVVGDGKRTIEELSEKKNRRRKKNPRLFSCLIKIDQETIDYLQKNGYTLQSVPKKGEKVLLQEKTNVSAGGDPIDVTDELSDEIKQIAINAIKAVPGLHHGGVDVIVDQEKTTNNAVVIELNPTAQIGGILYPVKGKARDIPAAIIDYYFPETIGIETDKKKIYFDLNAVLEPLQNRTALEVEVAPALLGKIYAKKYFVSGDVQDFKYHQWVKKEAVKKNLHGHVRNLMNGDVEIVVAGTSETDVNHFKHVVTQWKKGADITLVKEVIRQRPVRIGFEITEAIDETNVKSVEFELRKLEVQVRKMEKEKRQYENSNIKIQASRSWRYTSYVRSLGKFLGVGSKYRAKQV